MPSSKLDDTMVTLSNPDGLEMVSVHAPEPDVITH